MHPNLFHARCLIIAATLATLAGHHNLSDRIEDELVALTSRSRVARQALRHERWGETLPPALPSDE